MKRPKIVYLKLKNYLLSKFYQNIKVREHWCVFWQIASYKLHNANTNKPHNFYL